MNPKGAPQSTPIWVKRDGDDVIFSTDASYVKARNMLRDPRVSMSIHDQANPYRTMELVGRVELTPRSDWALADELTQLYLNQPEYPEKTPGAEGFLVRLRVERAVPLDFPAPPSLPIRGSQTNLVGPPHFAHVGTVSPSGQPRSSVVWIDRDGPDAVFWTSPETIKVRNLRRNPAIAISIHDAGRSGGYRYLQIRGQARLEDVGNGALLDDLARRYWDVDRYPEDTSAMRGVLVRVAAPRA